MVHSIVTVRSVLYTISGSTKILGGLKSTSRAVVPIWGVLLVAPFPLASVEFTTYSTLLPGSRLVRTTLCLVTSEAEPMRFSNSPSTTNSTKLSARSSVSHSIAKLVAVFAAIVGGPINTGYCESGSGRVKKLPAPPGG